MEEEEEEEEDEEARGLCVRFAAWRVDGHGAGGEEEEEDEEEKDFEDEGEEVEGFGFAASGGRPASVPAAPRAPPPAPSPRLSHTAAPFFPSAGCGLSFAAPGARAAAGRPRRAPPPAPRNFGSGRPKRRRLCALPQSFGGAPPPLALRGPFLPFPGRGPFLFLRRPQAARFSWRRARGRPLRRRLPLRPAFGAVAVGRSDRLPNSGGCLASNLWWRGAHDGSRGRGLDATWEIRALEAAGALPGHLPVVAMTANAFESDRERCLASGMDIWRAPRPPPPARRPLTRGRPAGSPSR
eukprot:tig00000145_g8831.t1